MQVGDQVEWTNGSYIIETEQRGRVVAIHDSYAIIERPDIIERYPHMTPFVQKRTWELRVVAQQLQAA